MFVRNPTRGNQLVVAAVHEDLTDLSLSYRGQRIALRVGEYLIGRGAECEITFDDPLISRCHAKLKVEPDGVILEDLGSANGSYVNGQRVFGSQALSPGDQMLIGKEELSVTGRAVSEIRQRATEAHALTKETMERLGAERDVGPVSSIRPVTQGGPPTDATTQVDTFGLLCRVVDQMLDAGRGSDAERMMQRQLEEVRSRAKADAVLPPHVAARAAEYALKLARATKRGRWIDYVFRLYGSLSQPPPEAIVDEIRQLLERGAPVEHASVAACVSSVRVASGRLGMSERLVLRQLEAIESRTRQR